jgi:hypothetical protein
MRAKLINMQTDKRNFIILSKHKRLKRLWQFFFTGWGLVMVAALVAGSLFTKQILWTPISAINMTDIVSNQFKMSGAVFSGIDKNGSPFKLRAQTGYQEYNTPNIVFLETVSGKISRNSNGTKITDNISANRGQYNKTKKTITLIGNVRVDSSNGDRVKTNELVIKL